MISIQMISKFFTLIKVKLNLILSIFNNLKIKEEYSVHLISGINENVFRLSKSTNNWILFCQSFKFKQIINDLTEINYTVQMKGKSEKFKKIRDNIFRYSDSKEAWLSVCKFNNHIQCCNYVTQKNYCKGHQSLCIIKEDEHNYFYMYIGCKKYFFDDYKGDRLRLQNDEWKLVCIFVDVERCVNLQTNECFCDRHQNDVDNGKKNNDEIGDNSEIYVSELVIETGEFNEVKVIGRENSELDIIYYVLFKI